MAFWLQACSFVLDNHSFEPKMDVNWLMVILIYCTLTSLFFCVFTAIVEKRNL